MREVNAQMRGEDTAGSPHGVEYWKQEEAS